MNPGKLTVLKYIIISNINFHLIQLTVVKYIIISNINFHLIQLTVVKYIDNINFHLTHTQSFVILLGLVPTSSDLHISLNLILDFFKVLVSSHTKNKGLNECVCQLLQGVVCLQASAKVV